MQDIILFDLDGTLFDSERFGKLVRAEFSKILNISEEDLMRVIADYYAALESRTDFTPQDLVGHISKSYNVDRIVLDKLFWEKEKNYKDSIFPEVPDVLKNLSQTKTLGIFSQGLEDFQKRKIEAGGVGEFFNKEYIFILRRKLSEEAFSLIPKNVTIIENKHDICEVLSRNFDTIWINRKSQDSDPKIKTIHSLNEIL